MKGVRIYVSLVYIREAWDTIHLLILLNNSRFNYLPYYSLLGSCR